MIAMIGTSDRLCWLAETCKILLLLLLQGDLATLRMICCTMCIHMIDSVQIGIPSHFTCTAASLLALLKGKQAND